MEFNFDGGGNTKKITIKEEAVGDMRTTVTEIEMNDPEGGSLKGKNRWHEESNNSELHKEKLVAIREIKLLTDALNKKIKELDSQGIYVYGEVRQDDPMTGRAPIFLVDIFNRNS